MKSMTIIALWGRQKTGKTTTLKMVYNELKAKGYSLLHKPDENEGDFYAIFEIDGIKVGLFTGGDNAGCLDEPFKAFLKAECAICITASRVRRTRNGSVTFLEGIRNSDIIWHRKAVIYSSHNGVVTDPTDEQSEINKIQAGFIIKELKQLLKN